MNKPAFPFQTVSANDELRLFSPFSISPADHEMFLKERKRSEVILNPLRMSTPSLPPPPRQEATSADTHAPLGAGDNNTPHGWRTCVRVCAALCGLLGPCPNRNVSVLKAVVLLGARTSAGLKAGSCSVPAVLTGVSVAKGAFGAEKTARAPR